MILSALLVYGRAARVMMQRTRAAFVVRSKVNTLLVNRHLQADAVILITANSGYLPSLASRRPQLVIYTDYGNLISKTLQDRGFALDERKTYPLWNVLERRALSMQDRVFVMGKHVKPALEAAYGIAPAKVTVVGAGPGLDVDIERDRGIKDPSNRVDFVCRQTGESKGARGAAASLRPSPRRLSGRGSARGDRQPGGCTWSRVSRQALGARAQGTLLFVQRIYHAGLQRAAGFGVPRGDVVQMRVHRYRHRFHAGDSSGTGSPDISSNPEIPLHWQIASWRCSAIPIKTRSMGERGYAAAKQYWNWDAVVGRMLERDYAGRAVLARHGA